LTVELPLLWLTLSTLPVMKVTPAAAAAAARLIEAYKL
jgi:hypothetical protein